jgi:tellurite resistance protein TehA-like permease
MGTGIVSVALLLDDRVTLSRIVLALAGGVWLALALHLAQRFVRDRASLAGDARSPAALTGVAATAVLATRLAMLGWTPSAVALLAIAVALWAVLMPPLLAAWSAPAAGTAFMLTVATESLALPLVALALRDRTHWLVAVALVPFVLGLCFYPLVLARFDLRELAIGEGDHWVSGGALAICALVAADLGLAAKQLAVLRAGALDDAALALWALAILWLPLLVGLEVAHRRVRYDLRRWATVFPVGMYAACSFAVAAAVSAPAIASFARVWVWVAVALWLVVAAATVRRMTADG